MAMVICWKASHDNCMSYVVGIAYTQAVKIIKMKDLEKPCAADDPEGFVQAMQQHEAENAEA